MTPRRLTVRDGSKFKRGDAVELVRYDFKTGKSSRGVVRILGLWRPSRVRRLLAAWLRRLADRLDPGLAELEVSPAFNADPT